MKEYNDNLLFDNVPEGEKAVVSEFSLEALVRSSAHDAGSIGGGGDRSLQRHPSRNRIRYVSC